MLGIDWLIDGYLSCVYPNTITVFKRWFVGDMGSLITTLFRFLGRQSSSNWDLLWRCFKSIHLWHKEASAFSFRSSRRQNFKSLTLGKPLYIQCSGLLGDWVYWVNMEDGFVSAFITDTGKLWNLFRSYGRQSICQEINKWVQLYIRDGLEWLQC